jgi:hypothetical protein
MHSQVLLRCDEAVNRFKPVLLVEFDKNAAWEIRLKENSIQSCDHCLFFLSLDHFVRPRQHVRRNRHADLLRCLEIDDELEILRLLHGKIGRLGAFGALIANSVRQLDAKANYELSPGVMFNGGRLYIR